MRKGGNIKKGKQFERDCAHLLEKLTGIRWQRVPCSGAMATREATTDNRFKGDLFTDDPRFVNWCVECKIIGKQITLEKALSEDGEISKWWQQTISEAGSKEPILIFKYPNSPIFILARSCNSLTYDSIEPIDRWLSFRNLYIWMSCDD